MTTIASDVLPDELVRPGPGIVTASQLRSGVIRLGAAYGARRGCKVVFALVVARLLGPEIFGIYGFLLAVIEMIAMVSGAGFMDYLSREVAQAPLSSRRLWAGLTELRFVYVVVLASVSIAALHLFGYSKPVLFGAFCLTLSLFPRAIIESTQGVFRGLHSSGLFLTLEVVQGTVLLVVGLVLLFQGQGLRGVIWTEVIAASAGALVAALLASRVPGKRQPRGPLLATLRKTAAFNLYPLIVNFYDRCDVILLSRLAGNFPVGIYSVPYRAFAMLQVIPYGIAGTSLPVLSSTDWDERQRQLCNKLLGMLFGISLFLVLAGTLLADPLVTWLLGPQYKASALVLKILVWATVPMFMNSIMNTLLLAQNREKFLVLTAGVCLAANLAANLALIPHFSYLAAASVTILTELVLFGQNLLIARRVFRYLPAPCNGLLNSFVFLLVLGLALVLSKALPVPQLVVAPGALALLLGALLLTQTIPLKGTTSRLGTITG